HSRFYYCACYDLTLFFFSSRRRHTSFSRDWSSDVCSSDLAVIDLGGYQLKARAYDEGVAFRYVFPGQKPTSPEATAFTFAGDYRSEERRVGKECRGRLSPRCSRNSIDSVALVLQPRLERPV